MRCADLFGKSNDPRKRITEGKVERHPLKSGGTTVTIIDPTRAQFRHALTSYDDSTAPLIEAAYDPFNIERHKAAFLFMDDKFLAVPYQQHLETLSELLKIPVPDRNDWDPRLAWYDDLNAIAAQRGYVQGDYMPGYKGQHASTITSMSLKGTLPACRKAFAAFKALYPRLIEQVEWVSLEVIGKDGKRTSAPDLRGNQIDRRLGRRDA